MAKKKGITKILSCFLIFVILMSAVPVSVLASNSSDDVMGNVLDSLSEVDTHEDIFVSCLANATNEAAYDISDSNITGNISNSSNEVITQEEVVASGFAGVMSANHPPTASLKNPSSNEVTIKVGDAINFEIRAHDEDGNLRGSEWYLNGTHQVSHFDMSGYDDTDDWSYTFNNEGDYFVEANAFDYESAYSDPVSWTVHVVVPKSSITVIVKSPTNSAVTPDTAILYDSGWHEIKRLNATSNAYTFTNLSAGTYHTEAYKDNMFISSAENINLPAGVCQLATITTLPKRNLDVTVYYKDGSTPIKGATVKVYSWDGYNEKWDYEYEGITNSQGKVTFSSWPTTCSGEKYKLVVEHNGYTKTKEPVYVDKDSGSSYTITTDEPTEKTFYIRPACQDVDGNHLDDVNYEFVDYPAYKGTCDYNEYLIAPGHGTYKVKFTKGDLEATVTLESHLKTFAGTVVTLRKIEPEKIYKPKISIPYYAPKEISAYLGSKVTYIFTITNEGDVDDVIKLSTKSSYVEVTIPDRVDVSKGKSRDIEMTVKAGKGAYLTDIVVTAQSTGDPTKQSETSVRFGSYDYPFCLKLIFDSVSEISIDAQDNVKIIGAGSDWALYFDPKTKDVQTSAIIRYKITDTGLAKTGRISFGWYDWELSPECSFLATDFDALEHGYWFSNSDTYLDYAESGFVGKCLGMATTTILYSTKKLPLPEGTKTVHELNPKKILDNNRGFTVEDRIDLYQEKGQDYWALFRKLLQGVFFNKKDEFNTLKSSIEKGEPALLGIYLREKIKGKKLEGGHALVVYKIIETVDTYYLTVYDCNWPDKIHYAKIDKSSWHFSYSNADDKFVVESIRLLPEASFTYSPEDPTVGEEVTFDATPAIGDGLSYDWSISTFPPTIGWNKEIKVRFPKEGTYTVILRVVDKNRAQNGFSKTIEVKRGISDTTPPETKCTLSPSSPDGEYGWYVTPVTVTLESTDDSSGIEWINYSIDSGSWQTHPGSEVSFTVSNDGVHYITYYAKDKVGNEEKQKISDFFYIDKTKPSASLSINNGAEYTNSGSVTLYLSYSDATSGVRDCGYKNEGDWWGSWESCSSTKSWTLAAGEGTKNVYYQVRDNAGNIKEAYATIILQQPQPKLCTSPDPPSHDFGTVSKDQTRSWSFNIINCGTVMLTWSVSDDKTWITVTPTSGTAVEADEVTVTISTSGLSTGTHTGHVTITSNGGSKTGTITVKVTTPSNQPPVNPTLTPDKSSPQPAGTTIKWTASATDPDGDTLSYRFWLKGPATGNSWQIKRDWSTDNTWTWHTTLSDVKYNDISVWIRDGHHASTGNYDLEKIVNYEITPEKKPDLIVSSINLDPNPAHVGDNVGIFVTVKNQGKGDAGSHFIRVSDVDSGFTILEWPCSELKAGTSKTFNYYFLEVQRTTSYKVCTDSYNIIEESNEDNNCLTADLTVQSVSELNYKLDEYGVIQQEYNDDSGINLAAPPASDAMVLAPYIDLIPYGSVNSKVKVEIGITDGQVTEYDPRGNAVLSSGESKLTWSNQDVTTGYHAELFYEANFRHTREVEAKIIPDQLKAEVRNICSYPLYNIIVLHPDPESGYWHYGTLDYLGAGAKRTISLSSKRSPESVVSSLNTYLANALNNIGLDATQHRNDWISEWLNYWLGMNFGSTYQPRVIYRLPQNLYEQYFTCSVSPEPSKGMVRVGLVELFNVPTSSEPTPQENCKVQITTDSSLQDRPSIVYANGYYYVAYQSHEKGYGIFLKKFDSNWKFNKKVEVVSGSAYYDSPSLLFANNKLYVAYISNVKGANANDYDVIVKEYDPNSLSCTKGAKYLTSLHSCQDLPALYYKDGYFYMAYQSWEKGNGDIFIKKFDSSWNQLKKVQVTSKSSLQDRPSITYADGYFYVAYFSEETGDYDIFVKRLDSNLKLASWKKQITSKSSYQSYPFITFVNNQFAISYASTESGTLGIYMKKYDSSWNFIEKTKVIDSSANERRPSHAWDGRNFWIAYVYNYGDSKDWNIFVITPDCEGGSVPSPTPLP